MKYSSFSEGKSSVVYIPGSGEQLTMKMQIFGEKKGAATAKQWHTIQKKIMYFPQNRNLKISAGEFHKI